MKTLLPTALLALLASGLGVWVGASVFGSGGAPSDPHAGHDHGHAAPSSGPGRLDERTLANIGVRIERLEPTDHVVADEVLGRVVDRPNSRRRRVAWLGGVVEQVHVAPGAHVEPGEPLVTLLRDPIPRAELAFTDELLSPARESLHDTIGELLEARQRSTSTESELERLRGLNAAGGELPVVTRQRLIDLERELQADRRAVTALERELHRHGLTEDEIAAVEAGRTPPPAPALWQRALHHAGLWGEAEEALRAALPAATAERPWTVALIGELAAAGLDVGAVAELVGRVPALGEQFHDGAALLLTGEPLERVEVLARSGALRPRHTPAADEAGDVRSVHVQPGESVAAGAALVDLTDASSMWLRLDPVGREVATLEAALRDARSLTASPVVQGAGPELTGVRLRFLRGDDHAERVHAVAVVANDVVAVGPDGERTWALRHGTPYSVRVPRKTLEGVFVLEPDGVATVGAARLVFVQDGPTFRAAPVRVLHEDADVAVVAADGAFHAGDPVVVSGALALSQALQAGGAVDPHAGHDH